MKQTVEEAARENSTRAGYDIKIAADVAGRTVYECAFKAGANWRTSSVWHKTEKPDEEKPCLVEYKGPDNGKTRYKVSVYCGYEWKELTHYEHDCNIRWAYVEDLLPTENE